MYQVVIDYEPTEANNAVISEGISAYNEKHLGEQDTALFCAGPS